MVRRLPWAVPLIKEEERWEDYVRNALIETSISKDILVESSVGAYLLNGSLTENIKLYYWRQANHEVDFVLERRGQVLGLEVKSESSATTTGMQAFRDKFAPKRCIW